MLAKYCRCDSEYICELLDKRAMLERVLGNANKTDKIITQRARAKLTAIYESMKNTREEVVAKLELLHKDDVKVSLF